MGDTTHSEAVGYGADSTPLTYAYAGLNRAGLCRFYWRRFLSVGIPYLCWSVIYFLYGANIQLS